MTKIDSAIPFGALSMGLPGEPISQWLEANPAIDRQTMLIDAPHHMESLVVEWKTPSGTAAAGGVAAAEAVWGNAASKVKTELAFLFAEAPIVGLTQRRVFGADGDTNAGELIIDTDLSARGATLALTRVVPNGPAAVAEFLAAMAEFDGGVGIGWRFGGGTATHLVFTRRILFVGSEACLKIARATGALMRTVYADLPSGAAWASFAESTIPKLRPGEDGQTIEIRVVATLNGRVDEVVVDYFNIPTRMAPGLAQSFDLPIDRLELLGTLQGLLGVAPSLGGVTWLDRVRTNFGRHGLGMEFGMIPAD